MTEAKPIRVLPISVIEEDHRLEKAHDRASVALMEHRWHWTLDETNPERVSFAAYAAAVDKNEAMINRYANGYLIWNGQGQDRTIASPYEAILRAGMGVERQAVTQAIADLHGVKFTTARDTRPDEVTRYKNIVTERAEERGTSFEQELPRVMDIARSKLAADRKRREAEDAAASPDRSPAFFDYIAVEAQLASALRHLKQADKLMGNRSWDAEYHAYLSRAIDTIRDLIGHMDARLSGHSLIDWEGEIDAILSGGMTR